MNKNIRGLVAYYKRKFNTDNPFDIADNLGVLYQFCNIDFEGCYLLLKKHGYIFLNNSLEDSELRMVMAHELGHAVMHRNNNCYFIRDKTLLLNSKTEKEANIFAAELLIPDEILLENWDYTSTELSRLLGYEQKFIELRLETFRHI